MLGFCWICSLFFNGDSSKDLGVVSTEPSRSASVELLERGETEAQHLSMDYGTSYHCPLTMGGK